MLLTICICTHNRSADVAELLQNLLPQMDFEVAELLVVDSASSAETQAELRALQNDYSNRFSLLRLDEPGLSRARNAGVARAWGEWVAFLDDDTIPFPDYFDKAMGVLAECPDNIGYWGGRLKAKWPNRIPPNIGPRWLEMLSILDSEETIEEPKDVFVFGANSFYRMDVLRRIAGPFDPRFGRVKNCLMSGEETKVHHDIEDLGYTSRFYGRVGVEHKISPIRLTLDWVTERALWQGITTVALDRQFKRTSRSTNVFFQAFKIAYLLPLLFFNESPYEEKIIIYGSIGVIKARLFGIRDWKPEGDPTGFSPSALIMVEGSKGLGHPPPA